MAGRRDLTEAEIRDVRRLARTLEPHDRNQVERLIGEVEELRAREAASRQIQGLEEGAY